MERYEEVELVQGKKHEGRSAPLTLCVCICVCVCVSDGNLDDLGHFLAEQ